MWNELVEGGGVKGERASFQMKQSTDDLAKFKPSQTLTLNIALGSGSTAGASERERQPTLHQTHIVDRGNEFSPASCDFKRAVSQRTVGKGSLFSEDRKVQPKPVQREWTSGERKLHSMHKKECFSSMKWPGQ